MRYLYERINRQPGRFVNAFIHSVNKVEVHWHHEPEDPTKAIDPPRYEETEIPDPNNPTSPDDFILIDEDGIPLGNYEKEGNPDGTHVYIVDEPIPLGGPVTPQTGSPLVPQTGDNTPVLPLLIVFIFSLLSVTYFMIFKRKHFNE